MQELQEEYAFLLKAKANAENCKNTNLVNDLIDQLEVNTTQQMSLLEPQHTQQEQPQATKMDYLCRINYNQTFKKTYETLCCNLERLTDKLINSCDEYITAKNARHISHIERTFRHLPKSTALFLSKYIIDTCNPTRLFIDDYDTFKSWCKIVDIARRFKFIDISGQHNNCLPESLCQAIGWHGDNHAENMRIALVDKAAYDKKLVSLFTKDTVKCSAYTSVEEWRRNARITRTGGSVLGDESIAAFVILYKRDVCVVRYYQPGNQMDDEHVIVCHEFLCSDYGVTALYDPVYLENHHDEHFSLLVES